MKFLNLLVLGGAVVSAFLIAAPAPAQEANSFPTPLGGRVDANGMPTTHSTPAEETQTEDLNQQAASNADPSTAQADGNDAQYRVQQQQYQNQLQRNEQAQQTYRDQRAAYDDAMAR